MIRLAPDYHDLLKPLGGFWGRIAGAFFLIYVILTDAFLLSVLEEIVPKSLVAGVSGKWISLAAIVAVSMGTHRGMQRRGRIAEVSGGILLCGIALMMMVCIGQSKVIYVQEMLIKTPLTGDGLMKSVYGILCGFSAVGLLPFALEDVEKHGSAGKSAIAGVLTLGGILVAMEFLFPAVLGFGRMETEKYPVLPLLAGADLPGNVLARFDVIWMGFLLYSLLFSIGSLLHYGHQIIRKSHLGTGRFWMAAVIYLLSVSEFDGRNVTIFFEDYLWYIFLPGMLIIQVFLFWKGRENRKKRSAAVLSVLTLSLFLGGCSAAVEPEKRFYPLALGIDTADDKLIFTYGMPDLAKATGQEKGEDEGERTLVVSGKNFREIESVYNCSQEKFLDMGHLEVLVLGNSILEDERWKNVLDYLKNQPFIGEDMYVFRAENAFEVLDWKDGGSTSAGEYLEGLMENRMQEQKLKKVTLRDVFHERYERGEILSLPEIYVEENEIQVLVPEYE